MTVIDIEPKVLTFPIELKKEITCPIRLFNKTDKHVAFQVNTTHPKKYCVRPNQGVLVPGSICYIVVILQPPKRYPAEMQCKDQLVLLSSITKPGVSAKALSKKMFSTDSGNVVEEQKFDIVYVLPPKSPTSLPEVLSGGHSFFDGPDKFSSQDLKSIVKTRKEIRLNIVVDKDKGRVIYAETDKCFLDILLSFLTIPVGAIVHLLDMGSELGCMDKLCKSVDNLDSNYLKSSDQSSLFRPVRNLQSCYRNLVRSNKSQATKYCLCKKTTGSGHIYPAEHHNTTCLCGMPSYLSCIDCPIADGEEDNKNGLLFLKADAKFIFTDNLLISPVCRKKSIFSIFQELGINFGGNVEEMIVTIEEDGKMRNLLKQSLVSQTPLSDIFLPQGKEKTMMGNEIRSIYARERGTSKVQSSRIQIKILKSTVDYRVLYAETGADFVNLLFNLLTYHVGSFSSLPQGHPITCFGNLSRSVNALNTAEYFKSGSSKHMLLSPELPHKLCESVLNVESLWVESDASKGFVKEGYTFMVTDDLDVTPMSSLNVLSLLRQFNCTTEELKECAVTVGQNEAEDLLVASLTSKIALTKTFLHSQRT